jgi:predicted transposase YdaD
MRDFSDEERKKVIGDFDATKPEEVKEMISHLIQNLRRYYDEAILKGKKEGKLDGKLEGKLEMAKNLLMMGLVVKRIDHAIRNGFIHF